MEKTFVLDTNVILFDPQAIFKFGKNKVYIPLVVIEEIDKFKRDQSENGRNARHFSRLADNLRSKFSLTEGAELDNGGKLIISLNLRAESSHQLIDLEKTDNLILSSALALKQKGENAILITKDINLRIKADILGIHSEDYGKREISFDEIYSGQAVLEWDKKKIDQYKQKKFYPWKKGEAEIFPNQYLILQDKDDPEYRQIGRFDPNKKGVVPTISTPQGVWGIQPKNVEQQFAFDALLNEDIKLVTLTGKAGTGKTLIAIAAGLEMSISKEYYNRLLVSRPVWPMGRDIGFLPGDIKEKVSPWMRPLFDNMDFLFAQTHNDGAASYDDLIKHGLLHIEPLTYIRGRSIPGQYLIVDEAQNLSPHEVKTIITRAGEGSKIVLTGDYQQIDNPYLDETNNGLVYCIERLRSVNLVAHTLLRTGERSALSEVASKEL